MEPGSYPDHKISSGTYLTFLDGIFTFFFWFRYVFIARIWWLKDDPEYTQFISKIHNIWSTCMSQKRYTSPNSGTLHIWHCSKIDSKDIPSHLLMNVVAVYVDSLLGSCIINPLLRGCTHSSTVARIRLGCKAGAP